MKAFIEISELRLMCDDGGCCLFLFVCSFLMPAMLFLCFFLFGVCVFLMKDDQEMSFYQ